MDGWMDGWMDRQLYNFYMHSVEIYLSGFDSVFKLFK